MEKLGTVRGRPQLLLIVHVQNFFLCSQSRRNMIEPFHRLISDYAQTG
jgi:hypothetical protein